MKKSMTCILFLGIAFFLSFSSAYAQSSVTFQVNLKPQMEDSVFVPGRGDVAKISGDIYPLKNGGVILKDESPKDSVYVAEVKFSRAYLGKKLNYNFLIETETQTIKESMPRALGIRSGDLTLDAFYFDSFAW
jgi:hypothetical protein